MSENSSFYIYGGRVIDPSRQIDNYQDVFIKNGIIVSEPPDNPVIIDAKGAVVSPGLIDIHVHLREPGQSHKETIATGTLCAAKGGMTTVVCMPNTHPVADNPATISWIQERAKETAAVNVLCTGAITTGLLGEEMAPIGTLASTGIVALTDDGKCVQNHNLMRRSLQYAKQFGLPIFDHCQESSLSADGVMNEGEWSIRLGLSGWPCLAEEMIIARNILLAEDVGHPIHCQHISSGKSVQLLREAQRRGVPITGEITPHHIVLTDKEIATFDTVYKVNPPLRSQKDIEELILGIKDGTLSIFASDHAPHSPSEKEVEFDRAPFGMLGLETELAIFLEILYHQRQLLSLSDIIAAFTLHPSRLLKLKSGTLAPGSPADITIFDPDLLWKYDSNDSPSLSKNTPFHYHSFRGRVILTMVAGNIVWDHDTGFHPRFNK